MFEPAEYEVKRSWGPGGQAQHKHHNPKSQGGIGLHWQPVTCISASYRDRLGSQEHNASPQRNGNAAMHESMDET